MDQEQQWLLQEKYQGVENEAFQADLKRLQSGEPLAYIIGSVPFLDCTIYLDSHPLIPRAETEFWVEQAIKEIKGTHILDLCAGSGAIGVAVGKAKKDTHITFGELDKAHLPTIAKNLETNGIDCTRYKVFESDLFENIEGSYDVILTNPPYIDPEVDRTQASVKEHEPHIALYGGTNGMEVTEKIIKGAKQHLKPNGQLWIEHEPEQVQAIQTLAQQYGFNAQTHNDQYKVPRYTTLFVAQ